ncbi:Tudor-like, plant [Phytophthora cinnamomi]|uniref:Tudor-like, plant n=1 Tax=Phytophthora cinnamomi TaxID=4785 RepID=UPI003559F711|nr:Tudor-like, plant [Phytophthora cinnamomi]
MVLKTGMLVGIVGTEDMGVLIQIRSSSNTCVIKLNNGTLKKNVPLEDVEEAKDMSDTKEKKSPIRLGGAVDSPGKSPAKLASLSVDTKRSTDKLKTVALEVGDTVKARCNGGSRWFPGKIIRVNRDGTYDVEYEDGDIEKKMAAADVEATSKLVKTPLDSDGKGKKHGDKKGESVKVGDVIEANFKRKGKFHRGKVVRARSDGTFDIEYDVGASETHVRLEDIKKVGDNQEKSDHSADDATRKTKPKVPSGRSSDSDQGPSKPKKKDTKKPKASSSSESSESDRGKAVLKKGTRVTYRKADDSKSRRVGTIRKVHSDGSCDIKYDDGDTTKRIARKLLVVCSDSEDSDEEATRKRRRSEEGPTFRRKERVLSNWRRSSKLSKPRMTKTWSKATVLEKNADGTYTIRYKDGVVEEDVPSDAIKSDKSKEESSGSEASSGRSATLGRRRKRKLRTNGVSTESLFLLEQLAMTLFEEGLLKKKPKVQLLRSDADSSSSDSSSSTESGPGSPKSRTRSSVDKVLKKLFDSSSLQTYRQMFKENDAKGSGKISRSRIIALVEELMAASKPAKDNGRGNQGSSRNDGDTNSSGLTMVLAESASSGTEVIVVQKGQFVLRGTYVRVGAAIRDLYEERMVVDVSSNEEHAPGLTKIRLGVPLRFFHPVKELVSTILLPSMELSMRLEMSDIQTLCREIIHDLVGSTVEEVWNLASSSAAQEAVAQVLFSTKNALKEGKERSIGSSKSFVEAWMDANQTTVAGSEEEDTHAKRCSARIKACKLLLHHDIIAQEAQYLRKVHDSSGKAQKYVAVSKRVMQFVCCLCIDFSSQIASRVFLSHLDSVGIPAWVVAFHQAQDVLLDGVSNENQLTTRVDLFWKDWKGRGAAVKSINRTVILESSQNSKSERGIVQTAPRIQRSASHSSKLPHLKKNTSVDVDILEPDDDSAGAKLTRPLVSVSPVKESDGKPTNSKLTQAAARNTAAVVKKEPSVIHTLLSIDADSALRLIKKGSAAPLKINRKQRQETAEDEEALDSDAYSPFPVGSSSEDEFRRAPRKEKKETKLSKEKKSIRSLEAKDNESKLERDSTMSSQTRGSQDSSSSDDSSGVSSRDRLRRPKPTRTRVKPAPSATDRQHEALRAIFRKYDVDGDGFISFIDLRRAMDKQTERQSHRLSDLEIQRWITEKDRGGQGVVSFEDFAEAFKGQMK